MKRFTYTITIPEGIHARPAGMLVEAAQQLRCDVTVSKGDRSASARRLMALMLLEVHQGDTITVTVDGDGEEEEVRTLESFFQAHF